MCRQYLAIELKHIQYTLSTTFHLTVFIKILIHKHLIKFTEWVNQSLDNLSLGEMGEGKLYQDAFGSE